MSLLQLMPVLTGFVDSSLADKRRQIWDATDPDNGRINAAKVEKALLASKVTPAEALSLVQSEDTRKRYGQPDSMRYRMLINTLRFFHASGNGKLASEKALTAAYQALPLDRVPPYVKVGKPSTKSDFKVFVDMLVRSENTEHWRTNIEGAAMALAASTDRLNTAAEYASENDAPKTVALADFAGKDWSQSASVVDVLGMSRTTAWKNTLKMVGDAIDRGTLADLAQDLVATAGEFERGAFDKKVDVAGAAATMRAKINDTPPFDFAGIEKDAQERATVAWNVARDNAYANKLKATAEWMRKTATVLREVAAAHPVGVRQNPDQPNQPVPLRPNYKDPNQVLSEWDKRFAVTDLEQGLRAKLLDVTSTLNSIPKNPIPARAKEMEEVRKMLVETKTTVESVLKKIEQDRRANENRLTAAMQRGETKVLLIPPFAKKMEDGSWAGEEWVEIGTARALDTPPEPPADPAPPPAQQPSTAPSPQSMLEQARKSDPGGAQSIRDAMGGDAGRPGMGRMEAALKRAYDASGPEKQKHPSVWYDVSRALDDASKVQFGNSGGESGDLEIRHAKKTLFVALGLTPEMLGMRPGASLEDFNIEDFRKIPESGPPSKPGRAQLLAKAPDPALMAARLHAFLGETKQVGGTIRVGPAPGVDVDALAWVVHKLLADRYDGIMTEIIAVKEKGAQTARPKTTPAPDAGAAVQQPAAPAATSTGPKVVRTLGLQDAAQADKVLAANAGNLLPARLIEVIDADTVLVAVRARDATGNDYVVTTHVRFRGVSAEEAKTPLGRVAADLLASLLEKSETISLRLNPPDNFPNPGPHAAYDRWSGVIYARFPGNKYLNVNEYVWSLGKNAGFAGGRGAPAEQAYPLPRPEPPEQVIRDSLMGGSADDPFETRTVYEGRHDFKVEGPASVHPKITTSPLTQYSPRSPAPRRPSEQRGNITRFVHRPPGSQADEFRYLVVDDMTLKGTIKGWDDLTQQERDQWESGSEATAK